MTVAAIRAATIRLAEKAIDSSRARLGEVAWAEYGEWVEAYVIESARLWALEQVTGRPH